MGAAGFTPGGFPFLEFRPSASIRMPKKVAYRAEPDRETGVDAGREVSAITLGKRGQMPYVWPPRRDPLTHRGTTKQAGGIHPMPKAKGWQFLTL